MRGYNGDGRDGKTSGYGGEGRDDKTSGYNGEGRLLSEDLTAGMHKGAWGANTAG